MLTITQSPIPPGWFGITKPASLTELAAYLREQMKYFCEFPTKQCQMYWREVEKLNAQGCRYVVREPNPRYVASNYHLAAFAVRQGLAWLREENVDDAPVLDVPERTPANITMDDLPKAEQALASLIAFVERAERDAPEATILSHGNRRYSIGNWPPIVVGVEEDFVLTAFLKHSAMDKSQLKAAVGYKNPGKILRALRTKYDRRFESAITTPGGKGKGGYRVRVQQAN